LGDRKVLYLRVDPLNLDSKILFKGQLNRVLNGDAAHQSRGTSLARSLGRGRRMSYLCEDRDGSRDKKADGEPQASREEVITHDYGLQ
jgi:hypothetical protein